MTRARHDRGLDDLHRAGWVGERFVCRAALADACGVPLPRDLDVRFDERHEAAVDHLHVTIDGLSIQAATYPEQWSPEALVAAVERLLTEVTGPLIRR